jgi:hypothetical protein
MLNIFAFNNTFMLITMLLQRTTLRMLLMLMLMLVVAFASRVVIALHCRSQCYRVATHNLREY